MARPLYFYLLYLVPVLSHSCLIKEDSNAKMVKLLEQCHAKSQHHHNAYNSASAYRVFDSLIKTTLDARLVVDYSYGKGTALLGMGKEKEAIALLEGLADQIPDPYHPSSSLLMRKLALAYLRLGERENCIDQHAPESCIMPIIGGGVHTNLTGSSRAIEILSKILDRNPEDYDSRWLLNIAYMTLGKYPQGVPGKWLVPGLDRDPEPESFQAFTDVAPQLGLSTKDLSGGAIIDDFNNDGYLDIVTSSYDLKQSMHYFRNDGRGGFSDQSASSNLGLFTGGLNITQTDYNNDGYLDIFVLRGGWQENFGEQPNSLLRNNGDDTFTDVTEESGLLSFYPTQTCAWRDFNNDGWLDLFIGNESTEPKLRFPCELYLNNRNGTFKEVAAEAGCAVIDFVKGVAAGDYDNDGREDLYLSSAHGNQMLLKNTGNNQGIPRFKNVTREAGLDDIRIRTFPTWFWDYNNDGWLDIFVCGYSFGKSIAHSACTEALQIENTAGKMYLYRNEGNGRFTNVSRQAGLDRTAFAMGSNFGDFDNDGFLDMYLGTGNPEYEALVPNRLFRNNGKGEFKDLSVAARVGNLQKGHGVAISDIDHDGDQDVFIEVGGVLPGDIYHSSLYLNPGQNQNSWIHILLEGEDTNKPAVGSRIKISLRENGIPRSIYRDVNSGGSFGSSSYRRDIGLGRATIIDTLAITWHKSRQTRYFYSVPVNQIIRIREKETQYSQIPVNTLRFLGDSSKIPMCNLPAI